MSSQSEFVTINNTILRVDFWGGVSPSDATTNPGKKPKEIILMIPGNPGVVSFYKEFLDSLHEKTKKCIWILSHAGHDREGNLLQENSPLYNLADNIIQKKAFIEKYLTDVKLFLVGHSIGCKMILDVMKTANLKVEKCYLLFPTIERMAETKNGKIFLFMYSYFLQLCLICANIFIHLPLSLRIVLLKIYFWLTCIPMKNIPAVLDLIHPLVVQQSLYLANDEMKHVRELDHACIDKFSNLIKFYYGVSDGWVPVSYFENLVKHHKNIDAELCTRGILHAFVLKDSVKMAGLLAEWILKDK